MSVVRTCRAASHSLNDSLSEEGQLDAMSCFSDGGEFFALWHPGDFDVLFLDCCLPDGESGMDIARRVRAADDEVPIIFVTSSADYAVEGYDVEAVGYVVKPPCADAVAAALERAVARQAANAAASASTAAAVAGSARAAAKGAALDDARGAADAASADTRDAAGACGVAVGHDDARGDVGVGKVVEAPGVGGRSVALDLGALRWCTSSGHYLDMALERPGGSLQVVRVRMRFKDLLDATSDIPSLYSCMRGCLVDLRFVVGLEGRDFVLRDGTRMPISRQNLTCARDRFAEHVFSRMREDARGVSGEGAHGGLHAN